MVGADQRIPMRHIDVYDQDTPHILHSHVSMEKIIVVPMFIF
jgi:hypothetical protein